MEHVYMHFALTKLCVRLALAIHIAKPVHLHFNYTCFRLVWAYSSDKKYPKSHDKSHLLEFDSAHTKKQINEP